MLLLRSTLAACVLPGGTSPAFAAASGPGRLHVDVVARVWMAGGTMRLRALLRRVKLTRVSATDVFGGGHDLEMVRPHARSISTCMVDLKAGWDRDPREHHRDEMRLAHRPGTNAEDAVPARVPRRCPDPARAKRHACHRVTCARSALVDLRLESSENSRHRSAPPRAIGQARGTAIPPGVSSYRPKSRQVD